MSRRTKCSRAKDCHPRYDLTHLRRRLSRRTAHSRRPVTFLDISAVRLQLLPRAGLSPDRPGCRHPANSALRGVCHGHRYEPAFQHRCTPNCPAPILNDPLRLAARDWAGGTAAHIRRIAIVKVFSRFSQQWQVNTDRTMSQRGYKDRAVPRFMSPSYTTGERASPK